MEVGEHCPERLYLVYVSAGHSAAALRCFYKLPTNDFQVLINCDDVQESNQTKFCITQTFGGAIPCFSLAPMSMPRIPGGHDRGIIRIPAIHFASMTLLKIYVIQFGLHMSFFTCDSLPSSHGSILCWSHDQVWICSILVHTLVCWFTDTRHNMLDGSTLLGCGITDRALSVGRPNCTASLRGFVNLTTSPSFNYTCCTSTAYVNLFSTSICGRLTLQPLTTLCMTA